jgi:cytochrome c biogenesis factor
MLFTRNPDRQRKWRWRKWDQSWVPLLEGGLILLMGCLSLLFGVPLLFASLGPTAYEQIEKPELPSARFYNVVVGHWIGLICGFVALAVLGAWNAPKPMDVSHFNVLRVGACTLAVALTALFTLLAKAGQPAAYATAILVAIGSMQKAGDAWVIAIAVLILGAVGEPIRRMRLTPLERFEKKIEEKNAA